VNHVWRPYTQMKTEAAPLEVVATEGCWLHLRDGRRLLDGIASWWTACHGYNHPHIRAEVAAQLEAMPHVMFGGLSHEPAERLGVRLAALLPGSLNHAFFTESGSVSVEVAMKMAIQSWQNRGRPGKTERVAFLGGYHGDTFATMALCDPSEGMHTRFRGVLPQSRVVRLPRTPDQRDRFRSWLLRRKDRIATVLVEPLVQAAGGFLFHEPELLRFLREVCTEAEVLLIFDEIAVGFGRLSSMFACEAAGVVPDIITLSKALTGGTLPLAATVATTEVFEAFWSDDKADALMHGPTYMANPMGCAAANASLDLFEREPRLEQARAMEPRMREGLGALASTPGVVDVRARGALGVVELSDGEASTWLRRRFVDAGVWVRPLGRSVYLMPPLVASEAELAQLTSAVVEVVGEWSDHFAPTLG
jgi:adenosylmethionine---8-amino-7-oxononanoate aminotransferase